MHRAMQKRWYALPQCCTIDVVQKCQARQLCILSYASLSLPGCRHAAGYRLSRPVGSTAAVLRYFKDKSWRVVGPVELSYADWKLLC